MGHRKNQNKLIIGSSQISFNGAQKPLMIVLIDYLLIFNYIQFFHYFQQILILKNHEKNPQLEIFLRFVTLNGPITQILKFFNFITMIQYFFIAQMLLLAIIDFLIIRQIESLWRFQNQMLKNSKIILFWFLIFGNIIGAQQVLLSDIYGVRWFLGQTFQAAKPNTSQKQSQKLYDVYLFFNSLSKDDKFELSINNTFTLCSTTTIGVNVTSSHHSNFNEKSSKIGDYFQITINKCPIFFLDRLALKQNSLIPYSIYKFENNTRKQVFKETLRSPEYENGDYNVAVIGDWGQMTNFSKQIEVSPQITQCLINKMNEQSLRLMVLLGDLGYDLEGESYKNFLKYLEQFSSKTAILFTPGNHQSIKHKDIFRLYVQSFSSPYWNLFYGYFDLVSVRSFSFLTYNPENRFSWLSRESHSSTFEQYLKDKEGTFDLLFERQIQNLKKLDQQGVKTISFSHYPNYCSIEDQYDNCTNYLLQTQKYATSLRSLGTILQFGAHIHLYERSKQLCKSQQINNNKFYNKKDDFYQYLMKKDCSIYIIEGVGGNNYYVSTRDQIQLRPHAQKYVANTGFGVLSLKSLKQKGNVQFKHYSINQGCKAADKIYLFKDKVEQSKIETLLISLLILIILLIPIFGIYILKSKKSIKKLMLTPKGQFQIENIVIQNKSQEDQYTKNVQFH